MFTLDPQRQRAIEHRKLMQTIAKTETQIAALRRFGALPPETVAAVKGESFAAARRAYDALEGYAAQVADALQRGVDRAKGDADAADWQQIRKAHDRLNRVIAQQPLSAACHCLDLQIRCVEAQREYEETMARLQRMEEVTGLPERLYARIMVEYGPLPGETIH